LVRPNQRAGADFSGFALFGALPASRLCAAWAAARERARQAAGFQRAAAAPAHRVAARDGDGFGWHRIPDDFANPLVEPGFLGVSQGAAFGAALGIVFLGASSVAVQGLAIIFAFIGLGFSYLLARRMHIGDWLLRLVLAGIAVSALFSAGVGIIKFMADPMRQLPEITFWMLGGLASITWTKFLSILPACLVGLAIMLIFRWRLNLLALEETTAFSLGAAPRRERLLLMTAAVLATAAIISVAGIVSWVGLIMPHIARGLFGSDTRRSLPAAMLLGGIFAILCDDLARLLIIGEIPLGILTSLLGALIFVILMARRRQAVPA